MPRATALPALPEPTSSFGAAAADGWLYVYGGHVSPTHAYSTSAVSGHFARRRLRDGRAWETLPAGPPAQGLGLAVYQGRVYRVGGMQPRNEPGTPSDTRSLDEVARFDPATRTWEALPPLPAARSSHDVVMVGSRLFVLGGWNLRGRGGSTQWPATMEIHDLAAARPAWASVPQPFKRRALVAAAHGDRIYVIGGFDEQSQVARGMDVYDASRGTWSAGPALPGGPMNGFGPAAAVVEDRLVISVDDGSLHRLRIDGGGWEPIGQASPRIAHRLVPDGDRVLILGGARAGATLDLVESLTVSR
jgi:N-acetylneuraminic acid mutarotase